MANTFTQIYIHVVFAVEDRQNLIQPEHNNELQKYITGIVSAQKHKLIAINNMPDHRHLLVGLRPDASLSRLVRDIKASSSRFINEKGWVMGRFSWQEGFGAFSYSRSPARVLTMPPLRGWRFLINSRFYRDTAPTALGLAERKQIQGEREIGGLRRVKVRGTRRVSLHGWLVGAAYNLVRTVSVVRATSFWRARLWEQNFSGWPRLE